MDGSLGGPRRQVLVAGAMIQHPVLLAACLAGLVAAVLWLSSRPSVARLFRVLPAPFWCYILPMLASTLGVLPSTSALYTILSVCLLPLCLALLLMNVDFVALARLRGMALFMMLVSLGGIVIGGVVAFAVLRPFLPSEAWKAAGALSGSWMGGSANMLAVKQSIRTPELLFASVVVVDTLLAYGWMAMLIMLEAFQERFDRWRGAAPLPALDNPTTSGPAQHTTSSSVLAVGATFCVAAAIAGVSLALGAQLPAVSTVINQTTWVVILVTSVSLVVAYMRWFSAQSRRTNWWGTVLLYYLLTTIGARAHLSAVMEAPLFLVMGLLWLTVHGVILFAAGYLLRAPLGLIASASQASIGGAISGPIVAAVYRPGLASAALLMAVLGNVAGTYLGLLTARVCAWIDHVALLP